MTDGHPPRRHHTDHPQSAAGSHNYALGGEQNVSADRTVVDRAREVAPTLTDAAIYGREFLERVVRHLVVTCGVRQFLDIGSGLPTGRNVHEIAREHAPDCTVVYVDHDRAAVDGFRDRFGGVPGVAFACADLRHPQEILNHGAILPVINYGRPLAVLALSVFHFIGDRPVEIAGDLAAVLPPEGYLVVTHATGDGMDSVVRERIDSLASEVATPLVLRGREEIDRICRAGGGLEFVDPGLVTLQDWRPIERRPPLPMQILGAVARRPARS